MVLKLVLKSTGDKPQKIGTPIVFLANHLEHENSSFEETLRQLKTQFGGSVIPVQYPVNEGTGFNAIIDLLQQKMLKYPSGGGKAEVLDIPADQKDKAEEMTNELIEAAAENDESLMETFFENGTLTEEELKRGLKLGIQNRGMFPLMCVASKPNFGVDRLLDFTIDYLPLRTKCPAAKQKMARN